MWCICTRLAFAGEGTWLFRRAEGGRAGAANGNGTEACGDCEAADSDDGVPTITRPPPPPVAPAEVTRGAAADEGGTDSCGCAGEAETEKTVRMLPLLTLPPTLFASSVPPSSASFSPPRSEESTPEGAATLTVVGLGSSR